MVRTWSELPHKRKNKMQRCKGTQVKRGREIELITKTLFSSEEPKYFTWYRSPVPAVWEKSMIRPEIYKKKFNSAEAGGNETCENDPLSYSGNNFLPFPFFSAFPFPLVSSGYWISQAWAMSKRMMLNFWSFCCLLRSTGITGMCHHLSFFWW